MDLLDLDAFLTAPRVSGLALSPDGSRLVTTVSTLAADGKKFVSSLWEVDPDGEQAPHRLTWSSASAGNPTFLPDGGLLFTSTRPDPDAKPDADEDERPRLWMIPMDGAEARPVADAPAGIEAVTVARDAGTVAVAVSAFPGTATPEEDASRFKARKDAGVGAQLFERYPIRYWDSYVGPRERRLFATISAVDRHEGSVGELRQVTDGAERALDETAFVLTPDGSRILTGWLRDAATDPTTDLVELTVASGEHRVLASGPADFAPAACSPDGAWVVCQRSEHGDATTAGRAGLWLVPLDGGEGRSLTPDVDLWPASPVWAPDGQSLFFVADQDGRAPAFRLDIGSGALTRLSRDGAFGNLCPSPDGRRLYAVRSTMTSPPEVVVLDTTSADQEPVVLPTPSTLASSARLEEIIATAEDGSQVHSWLVLPDAASAEHPAPLVVFIHGGPIGSWNAWSWRWSPNLLAAKGYAVLLPDPAISTGYGQAFMDRGRGRWGNEPFTDVMAACDAAVARPDIDETRTAAMGGSFGGYMANWVAGHTDRFKAIVTHASLWALDQFHGTTDVGTWWEREFGDPYIDASVYEANSPHRHVANIRTPMLVIHGELDHRVPVSEALRLWTDLRRHGVDSRFLYFPDENHWVLKPQNTRIWYETVFAFLDQHVLGAEWSSPPLL